MVKNVFGGGVGRGGMTEMNNTPVSICTWSDKADVVLQLLLNAERTLYSREGEQNVRGRKEEGKGGGVKDGSGIDFLTILAPRRH